MLKNLWDLNYLVQSSFSDWNTTLWKDINVEQMDSDCKKFVKDIRGLDKEMRAWDAFTGLDALVKNMVTSLKAVGELQNPAIRDRHWEQLMQTTQVGLAAPPPPQPFCTHFHEVCLTLCCNVYSGMYSGFLVLLFATTCSVSVGNVSGMCVVVAHNLGGSYWFCNNHMTSNTTL